MSKVDKELKKLNQVAEGVAMIKESRESVEQLAKRYDSWIDEAAELGEGEYSDQLISEQVELEEFARNLSFLEVRVRESAVSARTFNGLSKLPKAMDACKTLLTQGPNLKKLGKQMAGFKKSLDGARTSLKDLRSELSATQDPIYTDLFGKKTTENEQFASKIEAKKKAREARLVAKISQSAPSPVATNVGVSATDIDAITAMIDEENKRG